MLVLRVLLRGDDDLGDAFGGDRESIDTGLGEAGRPDVIQHLYIYNQFYHLHHSCYIYKYMYSIYKYLMFIYHLYTYTILIHRHESMGQKVAWQWNIHH